MCKNACAFLLAVLLATVAGPHAQVRAMTSGGREQGSTTLKTNPELIEQTGHLQRVDRISYSSSGSLMATASADNTVRLWNAATGQELRVLSGHSNFVTTVAFSPDGRLLASGSLDKSVRLWDVVTGQVIRVWPGPQTQFAPVTSLAFSPDGQGVAAGTSDGAITVWDSQSGAEKITLKGHGGAVTALVFSPDRRTLASGGADHLVKVWDIDNPGVVMTLTGHGERVTALAFNAGGKLLASGSADAAVNLWDISVSARPRSLGSSGARGSVLAITFNDNGPALLAVYADHGLRAWNAVSMRPLPALTEAFREKETTGADGQPDLVAASFSPDAKYVALSNGDQTVAVRQVSTGRQTAVLASHVSGVFCIEFSADGRWFAAGGRDNAVRIWETDTGRATATLTDAGMGFVQSLAFRPAATEKNSGESSSQGSASAGNVFGLDNQVLATAGADGQIRLWDVSTGAKIGTLRGHAEGINALVFSPDGKRLASGSTDGSVKIWDLTKAPAGSEIRTLKGQDGDITSLALSPDGMKLLSGNSEKTATVWDAMTGQALAKLAGHTGSVNAVAFSRDNQYMATGGADGIVKIWEAKTGKEIRALSGQRASINSISFSPDSLALIAGSDDHTICAWDVKTGAQKYAALGHTDRVDVVTFNEADGAGRYFASASEDGSVRMWSADTGTNLATLISFRDSADWLVVAPDGLFDGSSASWAQLLWRFGNNTLNTLPVEAFFGDYYYPGLLAEVLAGRQPHAPRTVAERDRRQPRLDLSVVNGPEKRSSLPPTDGPPDQAIKSRSLTVKIEVHEAPGNRSMPAGSGARDVRLFRNGSLVRVWRGNVLPQNEGSAILQASIPVVAGENRLTAYAFNNDNIKSQDARIAFTGDRSLEREGAMHLLAIGINRYANPQFNLKYAGADADSFGTELVRAQGKVGAVGRLEVVSLSDEKATKKNILYALARLAGQTKEPPPAGLEKLTAAQPEDVVVIYFAGHGTKQGNRFYLIPHDLDFMGRRDAIDADGIKDILSHSISDLELGRALEQIDVGQTLLVLDACNSGQALEAEDRRLGPMNTQGLAQLAYEKGMYVLTAAESYQAAQEAARLGHGYLTYALIEEGVKRGLADDSPRDGRILVREWFDYATSRVPQIDRENKLRKQASATAGGRGLGLTSDFQRPRVFYRPELERQPLVIARP